MEADSGGRRSMRASLFETLSRIRALSEAASSLDFGMGNKKEMVYIECVFHFDDVIYT